MLDPRRYGVAWWLNGRMPNGERPYPDAPPTVYRASGWKGNRLFVIPEWRIVFVALRTELDAQDDPRVFNAFFRRLGRALTEVEADVEPPAGEETP